MASKVTLKIGNSSCQLAGLNELQFKKLKAILSYSIDQQAAYFSRSTHNLRRYLIDKKGNFPTGLLYLVRKFLKEEKISIRVEDDRVQPVSKPGLFTMSLPYEPYSEQIEAAKAAKFHHRGIISAPTGVGKSVIVALIINELQVNTLVVVPSIELKRQLTEGLKKTFGEKQVGGLGKPIAVENVDALDTKEVLKGYDCVITDEFHHAGAKTYRELNKKAWKNIYYRFGMTATPFRSDENEKLLLESVLSNVIYRILYQDAVDKGYIVPVEAYFIEVPPTKVKGHTWAQVYKELVVENKPRSQIISNLLVNLHSNNCSALCLVKEIAHGKKLSDSTGAGFANGQHEDCALLLDWFNQKRISILIGTTGVIGEGVDTKPCEYVIIAGLGKSKTQFMQQVGRAMRKYPGKENAKVVIFLDRSHKWSKAHFAAQVKILREEYGVEPVRLEI